MSEDTRRRTDQKLRFAGLHLDELRALPSGRGHDFERAHQEAVLAQLLGAFDALLGELNAILGCNLRSDEVRLGRLRDSLLRQGHSSEVLRRLYGLQQDKESWLKQLQDLRHTATHVSGIPLSFYAGGSDDGKVAFRHPTERYEFALDVGAALAEWLGKMTALCDEVRLAASRERAG